MCLAEGFDEGSQALVELLEIAGELTLATIGDGKHQHSQVIQHRHHAQSHQQGGKRQGGEVADVLEAERAGLNRVWHRLAAWPDSVAGLTRLKARFTICSLSNGNLGLLTDMAKHAGLPWDCVLSAEVFRAYKPDPRVYLGAAEVFDADPAEVLMVASHHEDLAAARACGLQTAYIERPLEFGAKHPKDVSPDAANSFHAKSLVHLAEQLGC